MQKNIARFGFIIPLIAAGAFLLPSAAFADTVGPIDFESPTYITGSISGQDGWSAAVNPAYDQAVVSSPVISGEQSFRISDAVTSGSFGDWVFAKPLTDSVGETVATNDTFSVGTKQAHFETQFDIASTKEDLQPGLHISVSPDRGDGSRMSYLRFEDQADGVHVHFVDVTDVGPLGTVATFNDVDIATISRAAHTVKLTMDTIDGPANDVVKVWIDGVLVHTGTSWEDYYRFDPEAIAEQSPRIVKTVIIQARGDATPADVGNGFLIDDLSMSSGPIPPPPPPECDASASATIVSDTLTMDSTDAHAAVAVTPHPAWTSIAGATWVYSDALNGSGSSPTGTKTFTRTFSLVGTPLDASLQIATDNMYTVSVNGHAISTGTSATDLNNFSSASTWTIPAADLLSGSNTITFTVTNPAEDPITHVAFGDPNPAGLLYKLTVNNNECVEPPPPPPPGKGEIRAFKQYTKDPSHHPRLSGWTIYLDMNDNNTLDVGEVWSTTDGSGNVRFMGLGAGTYHVREVMQDGWNQLTPGGAEQEYTVTIAAGEKSDWLKFDNYQPNSISGEKCNVGKRSNGAKCTVSDLGLSGWTVELHKLTATTTPVTAGNVVTTTTTDGSGMYSFPGLATGYYAISEVPQAGWTLIHIPTVVHLGSNENAIKDLLNKPGPTE